MKINGAGFLWFSVFGGFFKCCVCWVFQKKSSPSTEQKQFLLNKHLIKFPLHNGVQIDEL